MDASTDKVSCIRARMIDRIGASRFRTWFGDVATLELVDHRLDVQVTNHFVGNWIANNYMTDLMAAAHEVLGDDTPVQVRIVQRDAGQRQPQVTGARPSAPRRTLPTKPALRGRLEDFVVGPANRLAYAAAQQVAQAPGESFKLLVVHGGCGLGKTHLLQGICNALSQNHPTLQWRYVSGEEFTNEYIYAVKSGSIDLFRARSRNVDVLVIDDIHFLADKKATQEEFLHTFNAIDASGKAIVLSSDRHPHSIGLMSEPLTDRLIAGMVVEVGPPDFDTRRRILQRRAASMGRTLPEEVVAWVAQHVTRNVRELEGALYRLVAYASLTREPLDLALARSALHEHIARTRRDPSVDDIVQIAAGRFGVTPEQIHSRSRDRTVALARGVALYLIRKHTSLSYPEIGRAVGKKNHSTVLMAVQRIERQLAADQRVSWRTPTGTHEASLREIIQALELSLPNCATRSTAQV